MKEDRETGNADPPTEVPVWALLDQARREARAAARRRNLGEILVALGPLFVGILLLAVPPALKPPVFYGVGLMTFGGLALKGVSVRAERRLIATIQALLRHRELIVGPLLDTYATMQTKNGEVTKSLKVLQRALSDQLPRLRATDAASLRPAQLRTLGILLADLTNNTFLRRDLGNLRDSSLPVRDSRLAHAILSALEQVGDEQALPVVERIVRSQAKTKAAQSLQAHAVACREALQTRRDRERAGRRLLRPANAPEEPATVLLRPVAGPGPVESQQLLRPAETERKRNAGEGG